MTFLRCSLGAGLALGLAACAASPTAPGPTRLSEIADPTTRAQAYLGVLGGWQQLPRAFKEQCQAKSKNLDPNGTAEPAYQAWLAANAATVAKTDRYLETYVPLVYPKTANRGDGTSPVAFFKARAFVDYSLTFFGMTPAQQQQTCAGYPALLRDYSAKTAPQLAEAFQALDAAGLRR